MEDWTIKHQHNVLILVKIHQPVIKKLTELSPFDQIKCIHAKYKLKAVSWYFIQILVEKSMHVVDTWTGCKERKQKMYNIRI